MDRSEARDILLEWGRPEEVLRFVDVLYQYADPMVVEGDIDQRERTLRLEQFHTETQLWLFSAFLTPYQVRFFSQFLITRDISPYTFHFDNKRGFAGHTQFLEQLLQQLPLRYSSH